MRRGLCRRLWGVPAKGCWQLRRADVAHADTTRPSSPPHAMEANMAATYPIIPAVSHLPNPTANDEIIERFVAYFRTEKGRAVCQLAGSFQAMSNRPKRFERESLNFPDWGSGLRDGA